MTNQQTRNGLFVVDEIHNAPQNMMITQKKSGFQTLGTCSCMMELCHQSPSDEAKCAQAAGSANKN